VKAATVGEKAGVTAVTFFGLGRLPLFGGTWGTVGAAVVHGLIAWLIGTANAPWLMGVLAGAATVASVLLCPWAERFYARKDPKVFVMDEVAGYFLTVAFFPSHSQWAVGIWSFIFFRIFDIIKPPPIRRIEKVGRGWGIVLDDLLAGLYAALCVALVLWMTIA
jgi:phosphatidylglycerophosphatase A